MQDAPLMGIMNCSRQSAHKLREAARVLRPAGFLQFSIAFMARYWFHFELATVLLLIGIVAAWTIISQRE